MMAFTVELPHRLKKKLSILAKKTHRSKSFYICKALEYYIEEWEDYFSAMAVVKNHGKIYSSKEVRRMCGLDD